MKISLLTLLVLMASRLGAQEVPCLQRLDSLVDIVSMNYAGYYDKVITADQKRYRIFVDSLREQTHNDGTECSELLQAYCAHFRDKQLRIVRTPEMLSRKVPLDLWPLTTAWTADSLREYFFSRDEQLHDMEGIWKFGAHELALIYVDTAEHYQAVIMRAPYAHWKTGMVKFTLVPAGPDSVQVDYWRADMSFVRLKGFRTPGHISLGEMGVLHSVFPTTGDTRSDMAFELEHSYEVQWKVLEDSTLYIKVGSNRPRIKAVIDSLLNVNAALLGYLPEWIIDVRQNTGGTTTVFEGFVPYLYTRPYQGPSWKYWLSPENIKYLEGKSETKRSKANRTDRSFINMIQYAKKHPNTWSTSWSSTYSFDQVKPFPKRIAILTDGRTAGRAELFMLEAKGFSDRTIIVGGHTAGMLDHGYPIGCSLGPGQGTLVMPIARMDWLGRGVSYDNTGVTPDILVGTDEKDLVQFVRQYWASR